MRCTCWRPLPTYYLCYVVRMSRNHKGVQLIGVTSKNKVLQMLMGLTNDSKHNGASFSISTDWLRLQVTQVPRSHDLAIFVPTDRQTDKIDCFSPCCACAHGVKILHNIPILQYIMPAAIYITPWNLANGHAHSWERGYLGITCNKTGVPFGSFVRHTTINIMLFLPVLLSFSWLFPQPCWYIE